MNSPQSPLDRRTRQVVVATVVLVFGFLSAWRLSKSTIDPRYVGKWIDDAGQTWWFQADGSFGLSDDGHPSTRFRHWWVSGDRIVIYTPSQNTLTDVRNWLVYIGSRLRGVNSWSLSFEEYPVTKFDGQLLQFGYGLNLHRVTTGTRAP